MPIEKIGPKLRGLSHLALVSGDMARTVAFYQGVLGMPLVKTMDVPGGGQHFFFDIGNGDCLAFFWWEHTAPPAPGVAAPDGVYDHSAVGSMHHVAFQVDPEDLDQCRALLEEHGISYVFMSHDLDGGWSRKPEDVNEQTFAATVYFRDPDGIVLEFCAWLPPLQELGGDLEPAGATNLVHNAAAR
jgi:catechol 2,3-dioxygenase-like lactoylglutathione lyase family enzyme